MGSNIYVHYGSNKFKPNKFREIKNKIFIKPEGGLWASNINAKFRMERLD